MSTPQYQYLTRKPKSNYKQLYVRDKWIAARTIYGQYVNDEEPRTIEQLVEDFGLPIEVILEAIAYCESNPPEIREDWEREQRLMEAMGMFEPGYNGKPKLLSSTEWARDQSWMRLYPNRAKSLAIGTKPAATHCVAADQ